MPVAIYQSTLDAIIAAVMTNDLAALHRRVGLPHFISTNATQLIIASIEELDMVLSDYHSQLKRQGVTEYRRTCLKAEFQKHDPETIVGVHRSEILSHGKYVVEPFLCHVALMKIEGVWKAVWEQAVVDQTHLEMLNPELALAQAKAQKVLEARSKAKLRNA